MARPIRQSAPPAATGPAAGTGGSAPAVIATAADVALALDRLVAADSRLAPVRTVAGEVPLRRREPGFEGLCRIVVSQQVSVASAAAIWTRLADALGAVSADAVNRTGDDGLKAAGLSRPKIRTLRAIAEAVDAGLDLEGLCRVAPEEAHAELCRVKGIGPWTADIYLLFCAGRPDIFPAGDLALQVAVADGLGMPLRPSTAELHDIAAVWAPWRGVAARLFWAYYSARKQGRESLPV